MELKEKILDLLEKRNLTIKQLAEKIGMSETGFHSTLKNNTFKFDTIIKISAELGVNVSYFTEKGEDEIDLSKVSFDDFMKTQVIIDKDFGKHEHFSIIGKAWDIAKEIDRKAGGAKLSLALSNISDLNEFIESYFDQYYYGYFRSLNQFIEKALKDKKSKTTIIKELVPALSIVLSDEKLNIKPILKYEKTLLAFFNEISKNVPEEDESLYESIVEFKDNYEYRLEKTSKSK